MWTACREGFDVLTGTGEYVEILLYYKNNCSKLEKAAKLRPENSSSLSKYVLVDLGIWYVAISHKSHSLTCPIFSHELWLRDYL